MRHRRKTNNRIDNKVFKHTAMSTKKINIMPKVSRGGIQL